MLAIVCPGQGSQTPGFLSPWLELDGVRARLEALGDAAGLDLVAHGTVSDADTIKDTAVAQPLIVAAGLVTAGVLAPGVRAVPPAPTARSSRRCERRAPCSPATPSVSSPRRRSPGS